MSDSAGQSAPVEVEVARSEGGQRLDVFLANHKEFDLSRSRIQKLIENGHALIDGCQPPKNYRVKEGDRIMLTIVDAVVNEITGEDIPLDILFEDRDLAVINKPAGMVTHPGAGNFSGTLVNALVHHFGQLASGGGSDRPGIVHRLDKNTSGLIIIARKEGAFRKLQSDIQDRKISRSYRALVCGHLAEREGTIDLPIGRSLKDRKKMAVTNLNSRSAITRYRLHDRYQSYDMLEVELLTGRTHQIRVHLAHLGHPVFGDPEYGGREKWTKGMYGPQRPLARKLLTLLDRQALHAVRLKFDHPTTGKKMNIEADLPEDFRAVLKLLDEQGR